MRTLELNPEFNLLGQIDLNNVKIALDRDEMEETVGGYHRSNGGGGWKCAAGIGGGFLTGMASATGNGVAFTLGPVGVTWGFIGGVGGALLGAAASC
jgi:hypothetical protein